MASHFDVDIAWFLYRIRILPRNKTVLPDGVISAGVTVFRICGGKLWITYGMLCMVRMTRAEPAYSSSLQSLTASTTLSLTADVRCRIDGNPANFTCIWLNIPAKDFIRVVNTPIQNFPCPHEFDTTIRYFESISELFSIGPEHLLVPVWTVIGFVKLFSSASGLQDWIVRSDGQVMSFSPKASALPM